MAPPDGSGTHARSRADGPTRPGNDSRNDTRVVDALIATEISVGEVWSSEAVIASARESLGRRATAGDAMRAAAERAAHGGRASAVIGAVELLAGATAIRDLVAARAPVTVHVIGPPPVSGWDALAAVLDVGAGVIATWTAQDAVDAAVALRRAAEDSETPILHVVDVAGDDVAPLAREVVLEFVGAERPRAQAAFAGERERKRGERTFSSRLPFALGSALRELGDRTGRPLATVERFETTDADEIVVAFGRAFVAARAAARALRAAGRRVGVVGLRSLRPFFGADVVKAASRAKAIVVIEPLDVALAPCGPITACVKSAFADALTWAPGYPGVGRIPPILSGAFATLEDRGVTEEDVRNAIAEIGVGDRARRVVVFGSDA